MWWAVAWRFGAMSRPSKTVGAHLAVLKPEGANADGDPAADGCISSTVGRCNKSAYEGFPTYAF